MTNFEKWKEELTLEYLVKKFNCPKCPAFDNCRNHFLAYKAIELCREGLDSWGNQESEA